MARVLCVGSSVVDFVFRLDTLPTHPEKLRAADARIVGGGCAANAAVAVARLGGEAWLAGRLGDDEVGRLVVAGVAAEGVDCSLVRLTPGARSAFSSVYVDSTGERQVVSFRGEGLDDSPDLIAGAPPVDAVLADTRWTPGNLAALELARARGIPAVLDAEAPIDRALLAAASHVAFSRQGLASVADGPPAEALAALDGVAWACVTDGADGVYVRGGSHIAAPKVEAIDTLGAGDVWHGAFALRLAEGADETEAIRFANAAATLKCARPWGRLGCPTRAETERFLKETA
jgi:sulfofructose kinase